MNILSGCSCRRFESHINHATFAELHGYKYIFDEVTRKLNSKFDHKLHAILDLPTDNEWWFWLDDDAFFTDFEKSIKDLHICFEDMSFIFPKSPINLQGGWTFLSSGNFFFRNTQNNKKFFRNVLNHDIKTVKRWWNHEKFGLFTNGDQDRIIYELVNNSDIFAKALLVDYTTFNTRPYHFENSNEHFLVHFAGVEDKANSIEEFMRKFDYPNSALIPDKYVGLTNNLTIDFRN